MIVKLVDFDNRFADIRPLQLHSGTSPHVLCFKCKISVSNTFRN